MTDNTLRLAWSRPAARWNEAIPVGNGRIGAMVFGGAAGTIQVNDATAWSGYPDGPRDALTRVIAAGAGPERLARVREALAQGDLREADDLVLSFEGRYTQEFLPFADLEVAISRAEAAPGEPARALDLDRAVVEETLIVDGMTVRRRTWASAPAQALLVELNADAPVLDVRIAVTTRLRELACAMRDGVIALDIELPVDGAPLHEPSAPAHRYREPGDGIDFDPFACAAVTVDTDGVVTTTEHGLSVSEASRLLVALSTSTRAESWWAGADDEGWTDSRESIRGRACSRARAAVRESAAHRLEEHVSDFTSVTRTRFAIGSRRGGVWDVDRDILRGSDPALRATVMAEYGRYLLASSSRTGSPAANLQGIWNAELRPAWSSNYTININTEMNYWAAASFGMDDAFEPLITLVEKIAANGSDAARELYGARGWVAHHNSDMWGWALPVGMGHGAPSWAIWMMGGTWLCHNLWDRFEYSGDTALLRSRIWPLLRGNAEFCLDWLVPRPDGTLITTPSTSPENSYRGVGGHAEALGLTASMDLFLIRGLFERCLRAIDILGLDDPLAAEIASGLERLHPVGVGPDRRLHEWLGDVEDHEPGHRHLSPLVGLYPLDLVQPETTPELAEAASAFLDARGSGAMGWSWAWKTALRARLGQGEIAADLLDEAFTPYRGDAAQHAPVDGSEWGGLLPNLFSTHPPFQIDGNYGFAAAIGEMLLRSSADTIDILPALPVRWPDGSARGLRARGGWSIDVEWADGRLCTVTVHDITATPRTVRARYGTSVVERLVDSEIRIDAIDFSADPSAAQTHHTAMQVTMATAPDTQ